jgi:outer membrane protein assembly factor BamB
MPRFFISFALLVIPLHAADWPMWRCDSGRTASTSEALPEGLSVLWMRELPPQTPAYRDVRLQFDRGYEPVVSGQRLVVGSSREDSVIALDTTSGAEIWRVYAGGPVRFAPAIADGRVIFGSDDGWVRCVELETGGLIWQKRVVPSDRQLLGNGRMISVWPVRGGPVVKDGRVYFAAGVWPLEGVFIYCLDAATGSSIWLNDRCSHIFGVHPHQAEAFGGVAPQGYLVIDGEDLVVPSSSAYPARLDLKTGALKEFQLPAAGRLPGGWFASTPDDKEAQKLKRRGLLFDSAVNTKRHEDKPREEGKAGVQRSFRAGGREWSFDGVWPGVTGKVHSVIAADGRVFIATEEGRLYALGLAQGEPKTWARQAKGAKAAPGPAKALLGTIDSERGYGLMLGAGEPGLIESLAAESPLHWIILVATDAEAQGLKKRLVQAGLYGERVAVQNRVVGLPPYFASIVVDLGGGHQDIMHTVRPFGGRVIDSKGAVLFTREGPLPGSSDYSADWRANNDLLVKAPVGVLWFGDALSHFKRSPQPRFINGVMITSDKDWLDASTRKGKLDYRLLPPIFSDVYTGRVLDEYEAPELRQQFANVDLETVQPAQYRPPKQVNDWSPEAPKAGLRIDPMTGEQEPRVFPKSYGCDGGFDYGHLYTMRSGTAAFYDKRVESGTIHISGPRSGCTNSIVPANGVLNVPYFYEGCTCSYPLPMALALVSMPQTFEQWTAWGEVPAAQLKDKIQRLGVNFGSPGDRNTEEGTLWLDYPSVGGPSPEIAVRTEPENAEFYYHHSVWIEGGQGWPWVAASGVKNLRSATISGLKSGTYTVRLVFAAPDEAKHAFDVAIQGKPALSKLVLPPRMVAVTETIPQVKVTDGTLTVTLTPLEGEALLGGIEIIREGLEVGEIPQDARVPGKR